MKKVRTVIIGMGRMGRTRYQAMHKHGGYEIAGLCDTREENLASYECVKKFSHWKSCIDESNPDAVIVCTYNASIPDIVCYALEKGCAVFAEKPPGRNLEDARKMKHTFEKQKDGILKFGFNHRYHYSVMEAKALIDSRILGDVVCARGVYGKAGSMTFAQEWRNQTEISGGGIMLDQGIHMLDLLYYFLGRFTDIQSSVDRLVWENIPAEDSVFSILKTEDGKVASLHSSAIQWRHKFGLDLVCTGGFISLNGLLTSTMSYGEEQITYFVKDLEQKTGGLGKPLEHTLCFDQDESWDFEMKEFYEAICFHEPIRQGTVDDAVRVMEILGRIYHSGAWEGNGI